jgi:hypothetical protein
VARTPHVAQATAHYLDVLRNATHGFGTTKGKVERTNALLVHHDGDVPTDLGLLGYLYLLDVLTEPDRLPPPTHRSPQHPLQQGPDAQSGGIYVANMHASLTSTFLVTKAPGAPAGKFDRRLGLGPGDAGRGLIHRPRSVRTYTLKVHNSETVSAITNAHGRKSCRHSFTN